MKKINAFLLVVILFLAAGCSNNDLADKTTAPLGVTSILSSPVGDVVGKITVGYQGWFACAGDGQPVQNWWWHWTSDWGQLPSNSNKGIKAWPVVTDYTTTYQTGYSTLGNGNSAKLYSCYQQQTVTTQFQWMQQNGIDCAALQRFNPNTDEGPMRDAVAARVKIAAEATGRKFLIMYDVTGWTNMQTEMKTDWTNKMKTYTTSSAYANQNGKPVVCIWGFGFNDTQHPWSAAVCLDVINWFKSQGCYVIGGVPREWRTGVNGSRSGYINVYHAFNMLSPWLIGAIGNIADADNHYTNFLLSDQTDCNANGVDYQPCVLPGDLSLRQRLHGDLMWRQFYNAIKAGCQGIYISMYDEYNEGNQIAKTAPDASWIPAGSGFLGLDEDGTWCSSDYYLRLTGDGGKMLKGQIALTTTRPTNPGGTTGGTNTIPGTIQAENYTAMSGIQTETTSDTGGGLDVGWVDTGDWIEFSVNVPASGNYTINYRVASPNNGGKIEFKENGVYRAEASIPNTGGWQTWVVVKATVYLNSGTRTIRLTANSGGWNINWWSV